MPNHITNILAIQADEKTVKSILESVKSDEYGLGSLDFNKVIPMPESLHIEAGSRSSRALEIYRSFLQYDAIVQNAEIPPEQREAAAAQLEKYKKLIKDDPELLPLGKQCHENIQNHGYADWYNWSVDKWGSKWNSYGHKEFSQYQEVSPEIRFLTAWSAPHPILEKLSELYLDVTFSHRWADEDFGYNAGEREYLGGEIVSENIPDGGSVEAYELAADILDIKLNSEESGYYLSADESGYVYLDTDETYELIELLHEPALFSNNRITSSEIPKGLYHYDLRSGDGENSFATIEPRVLVNHAGSVITNSPIDFGETGYIAFTEETSPNFLGNHLTMQQFMSGDFDQTKEDTEGMGMNL